MIGIATSYAHCPAKRKIYKSLLKDGALFTWKHRMHMSFVDSRKETAASIKYFRCASSLPFPGKFAAVEAYTADTTVNARIGKLRIFVSKMEVQKCEALIKLELLMKHQFKTLIQCRTFLYHHTT